MDLVEVLERRRQLRQDGPGIAEVHATDVVALEGVDEALAMPLLCGLHTGVLTGVRPSDLAMHRVSWAMASTAPKRFPTPRPR